MVAGGYTCTSIEPANERQGTTIGHTNCRQGTHYHRAHQLYAGHQLPWNIPTVIGRTGLGWGLDADIVISLRLCLSLIAYGN